VSAVPNGERSITEPGGDGGSRGRGSRGRSGSQGRGNRGRGDWGAWPLYNAAAEGLREYWYPVAWARTITERPTPVVLCGERLALVRSARGVHALHDRCPHRGVPLSLGSCEFAGTLSCVYHGWTYDVASGDLVAVITDGPDSPITGKVAVRTFPAAEYAGLVWVYPGELEPPAIEEALPEELRGRHFVFGGRIEERRGNWRLAAENGFDEGHAKFLHRTALWRVFKTMPTWNKIHIEQHGRWIFRIEDERFWEADFPGLGVWTNKRWWRIKPRTGEQFRLGNTGAPRAPDPGIAALGLPSFSSLALPGVLRIAYPKFLHYEFYVPIDATHFRYVGLFVRLESGVAAWTHRLKYLAFVRWLFHGQFSGQDAWMVSETDCPPERLYRPDVSVITWRRLVEHEARRGPHEARLVPDGPDGPDAPTSDAPTAARSAGQEAEGVEAR